MERGVLALFGETSMLTSDSIKTFVNSYNIPFFTWSYPNLKYSDFFDLNKIENDQSVIGLDSSTDLQDASSAKPSQSNKSNETAKDDYPYLLNMHPSFTPLLISLLKYHRWETVYYIYDNDEGIFKL